MPPEKRKGKENVQSESTSLVTGQSDGRARSPTQLQNILEDKVRDGKMAFTTKHDTTHHSGFLCSVT